MPELAVKRILVALDASPRAASVLAEAAALARRVDAEIIPLRVVFVPPEFPPAAHVTKGDPLVTHLEVAAKDALLTLAAAHEGARIATPVVRRGQPAAAILETAKALAVDLVAIGSHGFGAWDRILGTTAARVANLCDRSVLVVHGRPIGDAPRILVAVDGSDRAPRVIATVAGIAGDRATVHAFRVVDAAGAATAAADLRELTMSLNPIAIDVATGRPWVEILRKAVAIDADLVVLGSHGYRGLDRLLGTTAGRVVDLADRNVLVVH